MSSQFSTLYHLLEASNTQFRVFDLGRRVQKINSSDFKAFEDTSEPYPYPLQQKAWFAIIFWDKTRSDEHYLWFLNFPLDEQGKLVQATRSHFIAMVIEILGTQLTNNSAQQDKLDNNPYTFKPDQNKLAALNARIKQDMNQPASVYYEHAQRYLQGNLGWQQWQSVGVQGLADVAARIDNNENLSSLLKALPHLPEAVETPLLSQFEHASIPTALAEALFDKAIKALKDNNKTTLVNCLRGLSNCKAVKIRQQLLKQVLFSEYGTEQDTLLVITARCWLDLEHDELRLSFLENLATASPDQQLFQAVVADLVAIPAIRPYILQSFRSTERSVTLATAIGHLFNQHQ
jgi:hypothetical protein